jgi:hypothetical protein
MAAVVVDPARGTRYNPSRRNDGSGGGSGFMYPAKRALFCLTVALLILPQMKEIVFAQESFRLSKNAEFSVGMGWSHFWLSGEMLIPSGGMPGSGERLNVPDVLGVDQGQAASFFLQGVVYKRHLLNFGFLMFAPSAMRRVQETFRFHNKTYPAGSVVETVLDFNWMRMEYGYKLLQFPGGWIAPRLGVHHVRHGVTLRGDTEEAGVISNTRRLDGTYPVLGFEGRYLMPYGVDFIVEWEGVHLITRGFLNFLHIGVSWQAHPDLMLTLGCSNRIVHYLEDNQKLNNEWFYSLSGFSAGFAVNF